MSTKQYAKCDFSISAAQLQEPVHDFLGKLEGQQRLLPSVFKSMLTVHKGRFRYIHIAYENI